MSNKSRRRVKMAAGALFAGAAIPIAAAGAAWADDSAASGDPTQTYGQLRHEGLSPTEARAVVTAEHGTTTSVEVSYNGNIVVDANNTEGTATASSVTGDRSVAAAIGDASATDSAGDNRDTAYANSGTSGTQTTAEVDYAAHSSASATGGATADINTGSLAQAAGSQALADGYNPRTGGLGDVRDTATASGVNTAADVEVSTYSKATASATSAVGNSDAYVFGSTHSTASATGYGGDSGNDAAAINSSYSTATASDTSGGGSSAEVLNAFDHSKSIATNDDNSYVANASHSTAIGDSTTFQFAGVNGVNDITVTNQEVGPNPFAGPDVPAALP